MRWDEPVVVEDSTEDSGEADDDDDFQGAGRVKCEDESAKSESEKSENTKSKDSEGDKSEAPEIQIKKNSSRDTLQSPHDPDASYGHKGVGYSVQIAETCNNKDKPEIITGYEVHAAARSDRGKALDMVEQLEGTQRKPAALFADGGYFHGSVGSQDIGARRRSRRAGGPRPHERRGNGPRPLRVR